MPFLQRDGIFRLGLFMQIPRSGYGIFDNSGRIFIFHVVDKEFIRLMILDLNLHLDSSYIVQSKQSVQ